MGRKVYEAMASMFVAEGVTDVFGVLGDNNMLWATAMGDQPGVAFYHARHEGGALAMADGYARASGRVGVCTVTSGPGVTQLATALTVAARRQSAIVVFAGDVSPHQTFHLQQVDQRAFVEAAGAVFLPLIRASRVGADVRLAFHTALSRSIPVVLSVPADLQELESHGLDEYWSASELLPPSQRLAPDPRALVKLAELVMGAQRPVIIAGAGAVAAGARDAILRLADRIGALLATTLRAKDWFAGETWDIGLSGGFANTVSRELISEADCVLAIGASLSHFTTESGALTAKARVIQIDLDPVGFRDDRRLADHYVQGDALLGTSALSSVLSDRGYRSGGYRTLTVLERLSQGEPSDADIDPSPDLWNPVRLVAALDDALPKEWILVIGVGHFMSFPLVGLKGRDPSRYITTYDFGTMAQALPTAIGVAIGHPTARVVAIEGDGGLLMNVQELETLVRHQVDLLVITMNDGAYGAEAHKLRAKGLSPGLVEFGPTDLARVAAGFGLDARRVNGRADVAQLVADHEAYPGPRLGDAWISPHVVSRFYRRSYHPQA